MFIVFNNNFFCVEKVLFKVDFMNSLVMILRNDKIFYKNIGFGKNLIFVRKIIKQMVYIIYSNKIWQVLVNQVGCLIVEYVIYN